jgi:hypothetical protein
VTNQPTTKQRRGRPDKPPVSLGTVWEILGKYTQDTPETPAANEGKEEKESQTMNELIEEAQRGEQQICGH